MKLGLEGKRALVTGGSGGIGFAIALAFCEEGATVTLASRSEERLAKAWKELREKVPNAKGDSRVVDLSDAQDVDRFVKQLGTSPYDIWVQNTGGPAPGKALELGVEEWDRGYQTLVRSLIQISKVVVPAMMDRRWGRVLNITSTSAFELIPNLPISGLFRAGLSSWVKTVGKEAGPKNVLLNNLLPGPTKTSRLKELETGSPEFYQSMAKRSSLGRIAEPEEIGRVAAFLCSEANTYLTGCDVLVDGGATTAL